MTTGGTTVTFDWATTSGGCIWALDTEEDLVEELLGLPPTATVLDGRVGADGLVISSNKRLGYQFRVQGIGKASSMANLGTGLTALRNAFDCVGTDGTFSVVLGSVRTESVPVQRVSSMKVHPHYDYGSDTPGPIFVTFEVELVSTDSTLTVS